MRMGRMFSVVGWLAALGATAACFVLLSMLLDQRAEERLTRVQSDPTRSATVLPPGWDLPAQRVLLVGDSRIRRWTDFPEPAGVIFAKSGIGGETSGQLERRFAQDALDIAPVPDDIIIATGINDLVAASLHPQFGAEFQADVVRQLVRRIETFVDEAQARGIEVSVATIIQPAAPDLLRRMTFWDDSLFALVRDANVQINEMAARRDIDVIDFNGILGGGDGPLPDVYSDDTLHFSPAAYDALNASLIEKYSAQ